MTDVIKVANAFTDRMEVMEVTDELIKKVQELSNPVRVDNYLKEICLWQQSEIKYLYRKIQELEKRK